MQDNTRGGHSGGSANGGAVALGCTLAARFGAHLEAYHIRTDPNEVMRRQPAPAP